MRKIIFYRFENGKCPIEDYFESLSNKQSDLQQYKNKRMKKDPKFWKDYDKRFDTFKIGVLLKQARLEAGLTQEQVARQLRTTKSVISRMENHATDIRLSTLEKFAKAVGKHIHVALL